MPRNLNMTSTWEVPRNLKFIYVDILNFFFFFHEETEACLGEKRKLKVKEKAEH